MDLTHGSLSTPVLISGWLLLGLFVLHACRRNGMRSLAGLFGSHLFLAALVALLGLWQLRAVTTQGIALHVLGATLLQLMFGWRAALIGLCLVLAAHTANGAGDWPAFGVNAAITVIVPVMVSAAVLAVVLRFLPGEPFAYILLGGFAAGGLAMLCSWSASLAVLLSASSLDGEQLLSQFGMSGILLLFPEAFLNGALCAWLAMFYPSAVSTWRAR
ncbi:MAG: hypothetical protein KDK91_21395 [Gammaproteobacteria bacterium]|nr:hypothetical protein [Gammaproteobacteria bacterium]